METQTAKAPKHGVVTLAHAIIALGICLLVIGLIAAWGAQSPLGPVLFLVGSLVAVVGGAVRYDALRRLNNHYPGDPQFHPRTRR